MVDLRMLYGSALALLLSATSHAALAMEPHAPPTGWGLAWAPLRLIDQQFELRGEWRQSHYGVAVLASAGGQTTLQPLEQVQRGVGGGTQALLAALGDMRRGLLVGAEFRYSYQWVDAAANLVPIPVTTQRWAGGVVLAARWSSAQGRLFGEVQAVARWQRTTAEIVCCTTIRQEQTSSEFRVVPTLLVGFQW